MMLQIKLKNMVCGIGNQLRYVDRFSTCRRNHKENIAEHQFFTAFFTLLICEHCDPPVDKGRALARALIHDVEEHYTGDIIRPVKHGSEALEEAMEKTGMEFTLKLFQSVTCNKYIAETMTRYWKDAKDATQEGRIVRFADYLSVLAYLHQEVKSGNRLVMENVNQLEAYSLNFIGDEYEFIRPLVNQSVELIREINDDSKN